jgi:D-alanyl-D-alanine carboxypeptidase/D-alanyl-D-alanine-endopeptidase (penicillin-binding protein 4)
MSPSLAEVVRDINKFSNNTMAQQLFYTLPAQATPAVPATPEAARAHLRQWLQRQLGEAAVRDVLIDNGSGLSRETRLPARLLAQLLQQAWSSPVMPELMASLPVAGLDGTMRRARSANGRAHLKTGSLRDSAGVAGYLLSDSGRRYVIVALINHPNANAARPAIEALLQWAQRDAPAD